MFDDNKKTGVICGLTVAIYLFLLWMVQKNLLFDLWVLNLSWLPYFYFVFISIKNHHQKQPDSDFRSLVREGFVVYLIAQIIWYLTFYLLFFEIDPQLREMQAEIELKRIQESIGILGQERADEMAKLLESTEGKMRAGDLLKQFVPSLLPGFVIAAIFALIVKRSSE
jgi:Ca2+/Na+ antiporter